MLLAKWEARVTPRIAKQNAREQEALDGYYSLKEDIGEINKDLAYLPNGTFSKEICDFLCRHSEPLIKEVDEVIGDELNHSIKWNNQMIKYGKVPAAKS